MNPTIRTKALRRMLPSLLLCLPILVIGCLGPIEIGNDFPHGGDVADMGFIFPGADGGNAPPTDQASFSSSDLGVPADLATVPFADGGSVSDDGPGSPDQLPFIPTEDLGGTTDLATLPPDATVLPDLAH